MKEALDNAPCQIVRGEEVFDVVKVNGPSVKKIANQPKQSKKAALKETIKAVELSKCKKGHSYIGDRCLQAECAYG